MKNHLIIYAKRPLPGYAKTRLGASIGAEQSAGIYARMLYTYLADVICGRLSGQLSNTTIELSVAGQEDCAYFDHAFPELTVRPQVEGDLGTRMAHSFYQAFCEGAETVVLTGSDIPKLSCGIICEAFESLRHPNPGPQNQLPGVVGPARDGGYYLIGMHAPGADIFDHIAWSTERVLLQTEALATAKNVHLARLPMLSDMDVKHDFEAWQKAARTQCSPTRRTMPDSQ